MSISAKEFQAKLEAWSKTPAGKKRIKDGINDIRASGGKLANGEEILTERQMEALAAEIMIMVESRLPYSISNVGMHSHPPQKTSDGDCYIDIYFNEESLPRPSLLNSRYPHDGVENIVALFNNGMDAKKFAYGLWEGHKPSSYHMRHNGKSTDDDAWLRSLPHRDPLLFMQAAVDEFNAKYAKKYGVTVVLSDDYTENNRWKSEI